MLQELVQEELAEALDTTVTDVFEAAGVAGPPIDTRAVAAALGLAVAWDDRQLGRARFVRMAAQRAPSRPLPEGEGFFRSDPRGSIFLRAEPRPERLQWAIAHEIGEEYAARIFSRLGVDAREAPPAIRETVANQLAHRLLLPTEWFSADGEACDWDLLALKARYTTASHELIARRMLDCAAPVVISVCDQGRLTWRRGNLGGRVPPLAGVERSCWQEAHRDGCVVLRAGPGYVAQCWPIHEAGWRREILRTQPGYETDTLY